MDFRKAGIILMLGAALLIVISFSSISTNFGWRALKVEAQDEYDVLIEQRATENDIQILEIRTNSEGEEYESRTKEFRSFEDEYSSEIWREVEMGHWLSWNWFELIEKFQAIRGSTIFYLFFGGLALYLGAKEKLF